MFENKCYNIKKKKNEHPVLTFKNNVSIQGGLYALPDWLL